MHRNFKAAAIIASLLVTTGLAMHLTPPGRNFEESLDLRLFFHLRGPRPAPPQVVIVSLDQKSVENLHLPSNPTRWPRSLYARLTDLLSDEGATVIVFDVFFAEPTTESEDLSLARAFRRAGNVLLCEQLKREVIPVAGLESTSATLYLEKIVPPTPPIADAAAALAPYPLPKIPRRISQIWRFKTEAGGVPTLPFLAFQFFSLDLQPDFVRLLETVTSEHRSRIPDLPKAVREGGRIGPIAVALRGLFEEHTWIADAMRERAPSLTMEAANPAQTRQLESLINAYAEPDSAFLNFYGPPGTIRTIPFHEMLAAPGHHLKLLEIQGKAVFVGLSELLRPENRDGFQTVFSKADGTDLSGVEIAATAFANLIEDLPVRPAPPIAFLGVLVACGLLFGWGCCCLPPLLTVAGMAGTMWTYLLIAIALFTTSAVWIPVAVPILIQAPLALCAGFLWHHAGTKKERAQIRKAFGFFLPDQVIDQIVSDMKASKDIADPRQTVFGVVLCSDGEQYAALSETMNPKDLSLFLNRYYEVIFHPVKAHRRTISDIIGDSMLAVWTRAHPDSAIKKEACRAAVKIMRAVDSFNRDSGGRQLHTRIGLHYGELLLGHVGGHGHFEYRPVGDVVNTASRIEGLNKIFGTRVLASREVMDEVPDFLSRELGRFRLYGKAKPVDIFELVCPAEEADERRKRLSALFSQALEAFRQRLWDLAEQRFGDYLERSGEDAAARYYLKECAHFRRHPPDENWDGLMHCDRK